jgi:hypothetical protein
MIAGTASTMGSSSWESTLLYRSSGGGQVLLADLVQHCEHFPGD